jgi:hypothetical protein
MDKRNPQRMIGPGYNELVPYSVRVTLDGEFIHDAFWNTNIGRISTSHGCTNLTKSTSKWFYAFSRIGDVAQYPNAPAGPCRSGTAMATGTSTGRPGRRAAQPSADRAFGLPASPDHVQVRTSVAVSPVAIAQRSEPLRVQPLAVRRCGPGVTPGASRRAVTRNAVCPCIGGWAGPQARRRATAGPGLPRRGVPCSRRGHEAPPPAGTAASSWRRSRPAPRQAGGRH